MPRGRQPECRLNPFGVCRASRRDCSCRRRGGDSQEGFVQRLTPVGRCAERTARARTPTGMSSEPVRRLSGCVLRRQSSGDRPLPSVDGSDRNHAWTHHIIILAPVRGRKRSRRRISPSPHQRVRRIMTPTSNRAPRSALHAQYCSRLPTTEVRRDARHILHVPNADALNASSNSHAPVASGME